jgi:hypothetical protein
MKLPFVDLGSFPTWLEAGAALLSAIFAGLAWSAVKSQEKQLDEQVKNSSKLADAASLQSKAIMMQLEFTENLHRPIFDSPNSQTNLRRQSDQSSRSDNEIVFYFQNIGGIALNVDVQFTTESLYVILGIDPNDRRVITNDNLLLKIQRKGGPSTGKGYNDWDDFLTFYIQYASLTGVGYRQDVTMQRGKYTIQNPIKITT